MTPTRSTSPMTSRPQSSHPDKLMKNGPKTMNGSHLPEPEPSHDADCTPTEDMGDAPGSEGGEVALERPITKEDPHTPRGERPAEGPDAPAPEEAPPAADGESAGHTSEEPADPDGEEEGDATHLDVLLQAAAACDFFEGTDGDGYARVPRASGTLIVALRSSLFDRWLRADYFERAPRMRRSSARAPSKEAVEQAISTLEARALFHASSQGKQRVFLRTGGTYDEDGRLCRIYIDLANEAGEVVEITPGAWRVITNPPVNLLRTAKQHALPRPDPAGSLAELVPLLRTEREYEKVFVLAWLVFAFHPDGPYPVLVLHGPAGAGKSTETKFLRSLVDPVETMVRRPPRTPEDLFVWARHNAVVALENISNVSDRQSDDLCSIATGAGVASRALYTNADESSYTVKRPVLINGIEEFVRRNDLASHTLKVHIPALSATDRKAEGRIRHERDRARPRVLGGICHALAEALRHPAHRPQRLPRMADFACFVDAARAVFPPGTPSLIEALSELQDEMARERAEASPVCTALAAALREQPDHALTGDMKSWWQSLQRYTAEGEGWPRNVQAFRSAVRREEPVLSHMGIHLEALQQKDPITRRALYRFRREAPAPAYGVTDPSDPSDPSQSSSNAPDAPREADPASKDPRRIHEGWEDGNGDSSTILRESSVSEPRDSSPEDPIPGYPESLPEGSKDPKDRNTEPRGVPSHDAGAPEGDGLPGEAAVDFIFTDDAEDEAPF